MCPGYCGNHTAAVVESSMVESLMAGDIGRYEMRKEVPACSTHRMMHDDYAWLKRLMHSNTTKDDDSIRAPASRFPSDKSPKTLYPPNDLAVIKLGLHPTALCNSICNYLEVSAEHSQCKLYKMCHFISVTTKSSCRY